MAAGTTPGEDWMMHRLFILLIAVACSAAPTAATCSTVVRPRLMAILTWRDDSGRAVRVDSVYSKVEVLADTVRVCE